MCGGCEGRKKGGREGLTVLAFYLGDAGDVTGAKGESGARKQKEGEKPEEERVWLDASHGL